MIVFSDSRVKSLRGALETVTAQLLFVRPSIVVLAPGNSKTATGTPVWAVSKTHSRALFVGGRFWRAKYVRLIYSLWCAIMIHY